MMLPIVLAVVALVLLTIGVVLGYRDRRRKRRRKRAAAETTVPALDLEPFAKACRELGTELERAYQPVFDAMAHACNEIAAGLAKARLDAEDEDR